jgi:thiol-disulfide isomerase/thioredoxin
MKTVAKKQMLVLSAVTVLIVAGIFLLESPSEGVVCEYEETGNVYSITYADDKGKCRELSEFKNQVVVINSWASWCPFCVEELPDLARLADDFSEISVIAINRAESSKNAKEFLSTLPLSKKMHTLFDPEDSFYRYIDGFGMPETIFIDSSGAKLFHKRGVMSFQEMRDTVNLLINRTQPNGSVYNKSVCLGDGESCSVN